MAVVAPTKGIYQSAGVWRNPTTGKLFQSATGVIPSASIPKAPTTPTTKTNPAATTAANITNRVNEVLGNAKQGLPTTTASPVTDTSAPKFSTIAAPTGGALSADQIAYNNILAKIANKTATTADLHERNRLYNLVQNPNNPALQQPTAPPPPAPSVTPEAAPPAPVAPPPTDPATLKDLYDQLFPGGKPIDQDRIGKDVLYQDALKRGTAALDKRNAARGLTGSGFESEQYNDFTSGLGAKTAERISNVDQQEASRLWAIQQYEATRGDTKKQNDYANKLSLIQTLLSQDPSASIDKATGTASGLTVDQSNALAAFLKNNFKTIMPALTASSGGVTTGTTTTVPTGGPDYSNITPTIIAGDNASNSSTSKIVNDLIANLLN